MKRRIFSIITTLALLLTLLPTTALGAGNDLTLSASVSGTDYTYTYSNNTATLTLDGANIGDLTIDASNYLTLNIITNSDSSIGALYLINGSYNIGTYYATLSGPGKLTIGSFPGGGDADVTVTVAQGADVVVENDLTFGNSGYDSSTLTVAGTLTVEGPVHCGAAVIESTGKLTCEYLGLAGNGSSSDSSLVDAFVLTAGGKIAFTGGSDVAALYVDIGMAQLNAADVINLPSDTFPPIFYLDSVSTQGVSYATIMKRESTYSVPLGGNGNPIEGVASAADLSAYYRATVSDPNVGLRMKDNSPFHSSGSVYSIQADAGVYVVTDDTLVISSITVTNAANGGTIPLQSDDAGVTWFQMPRGNVTVSANTMPFHTVTYVDDQFSKAPAPVKVPYDGITVVYHTVPSLTPPANSNYAFLGWRANDDAGTLYPPGIITLEGDIILTAVWDDLTDNTYTVTYNPYPYGSGTASTATKTHDVPLTLAGALFTRPGYIQTGWETSAEAGNGVQQKYNLGASYTDNAPIILYPTWTADSSGPSYVPPVYRITVEEAENGAVGSSHSFAYGGSTVTLTVTPQAGWGLSSLLVADSQGRPVPLTDLGGGVYTFTMPHSSVTVRPAFSARWSLGYAGCPRNHTCPIWPFTDAETTAWYHDGVHFCLENGLMGSTDAAAATFEPETPISLGMVVTILHRLAGSPAPAPVNPFDVITPGQWYTDGAIWAAQCGIIDGASFSPDGAVPREELFVMLWRWARHMGYDVSAGAQTSILTYPDASAVSGYALPAMRWACGSGLLVGRQNGDALLLEPAGSTTRMELATLLLRLCTHALR